MKDAKIKQFALDLIEFSKIPKSKLSFTNAPFSIGATRPACIVPNKIPSYKRIIKFIMSIPVEKLVKETDVINSKLGSPIFMVMGSDEIDDMIVICNTGNGPIIMIAKPDHEVDTIPEISDKDAIDILTENGLIH